MIEAWMIIAVYVATPLCFVVGFTLGKGHVRRLASTGTEIDSPTFVADAVQAYREQYHPEELRDE